MTIKGKVAKSAPDALVLLWQEGFFDSWRSKGEIEDHLGKKGYHFSDALKMALTRVKHLTRKGKHGSYEYIQKYPFTQEEPKHDVAGNK